LDLDVGGERSGVVDEEGEEDGDEEEVDEEEHRLGFEEGERGEITAGDGEGRDEALRLLDFGRLPLAADLDPEPPGLQPRVAHGQQPVPDVLIEEVDSSFYLGRNYHFRPPLQVVIECVMGLINPEPIEIETGEEEERQGKLVPLEDRPMIPLDQHYDPPEDRHAPERFEEVVIVNVDGEERVDGEGLEEKVVEEEGDGGDGEEEEDGGDVHGFEGGWRD